MNRRRERERESDATKNSRCQLPQHRDEKVEATKKECENEKKRANMLPDKRVRKREIENSKHSKMVL